MSITFRRCQKRKNKEMSKAIMKEFYLTLLTAASLTDLNTATSFLNPCNWWGLGSETFNVFIATAPGV